MKKEKINLTQSQVTVAESLGYRFPKEIRDRIFGVEKVAPKSNIIFSGVMEKVNVATHAARGRWRSKGEKNATYGHRTRRSWKNYRANQYRLITK